MNAQTAIKPASVDTIPFDSYAAYQREREYSRKIERQLSKALMFLEFSCNSREAQGEDVSHLRAFIAEARK